jgi:hypothetical protein
VLISKQNSNIRKDQESFREIQQVHRRTAIVRGTGTLQEISRRRQDRRFGDDFVLDRADFRSILLSTCGISPKFLEILSLHRSSQIWPEGALIAPISIVLGTAPGPLNDPEEPARRFIRVA